MRSFDVRSDFRVVSAARKTRAILEGNVEVNIYGCHTRVRWRGADEGRWRERES